ncbi:MAG: MFS transporter [Bryobacterales bacterium]|nr:MFS transporter [Bryobacterales bacterium]
MQESRSVSGYAWLVVALLVPVAMLNYLDRQMLASMKFSLMHDIPDIGSEANWGAILAFFKWTYAFLSPFGGYVADRTNRRYVIAGSLLVWSVITWLTAHVTTYEQLLLTRTAMGISEAFYIPAALALIADYHVGETRSRAVGFHQMGIYAGVILGGFSGYAADHPDLGWRWMFDLCGFVGVLYAIPLFLMLKDPFQKAEVLKSDQISPLKAIKELAGNRSFQLLVVYFTLPAMAGWIIRDWMPAILKTEFGIGQGEAGVSATLYWMLAAAGAAVGGGWMADRWMRKNNRGRIYTSAIGMGLIVISLAGVGLSPQTGLLSVAVASLVVFGVGYGFFDINNMPILCQIVRPHLRASGYGMMNFVSISFGGIADWAFGISRDAGVPLVVTFTVVAALSLLSLWLVLLIRPKYSDEGPAPVTH